MRVSDDPTNAKASSILRRDFRATHGDPEVPKHHKHGTGSGHHWCKRQEGREHDFELVAVASVRLWEGGKPGLGVGTRVCTVFRLACGRCGIAQLPIRVASDWRPLGFHFESLAELCGKDHAYTDVVFTDCDEREFPLSRWRSPTYQVCEVCGTIPRKKHLIAAVG